MTYYGFTSQEWNNTKREIIDILVSQIKNNINDELIPYSELAKSISTINLNPNDYALAELLGEISTSEAQSGRGMLSVLVIHKEGDNMPGDGFFNLAFQLGYSVINREQFWINELKKVIDYWRK